MKILKSENYKIMPWKNKLGITSEIAIYPTEAKFQDGNFGWRISSARIQNKNQFSVFTGYNRLLIVIKGNGLILNSCELKPLEPIQFKGEENILCDLVNGEAIDLGVIYKRVQFSAKMNVLKFQGGSKSNIKNEIGTSFLFCVSGKLKFNDAVINTFDAVELKDQSIADVSCIVDSVCVQIILNEKNYK